MTPHPQSRSRRISLYAIAALFVGAGIAHFTHEAFFVRIVPAVRRAAGLGLIVLLVAVFPANLYMALEPERFSDIASPTGLYLRLPLQFLAMFWVRWATASPRAPA